MPTITTHSRLLCSLAALALSCSSPGSSPPPPGGSDLAGQPGQPGSPDSGVDLAQTQPQTQVPPKPVPTGPALWRQYQDVDVTTSAVPAGSALSVELWSDGSNEELAGFGLRFNVDQNGTAHVLVRQSGTGKTPDGSSGVIAEVGSDDNKVPRVAGAALGLRVRGNITPTTISAVVHLDVNGKQDVETWTIDDAHFYWGRHAVVLAQPPAPFTIQVQPQPPPGSFSFNRAYDSLIEWKVFQRAGAAATLPLPFVYQSSGDAKLVLEVLDQDSGAPVPGFPAVTFALPAAQSPQNMLGALAAVPQGGNYQLRGSLIAADGSLLGTDTVQNIAVGDVFLMSGQSNMDGYGDHPPFESPIPQVHSFGNDYMWKLAVEPINGLVNQTDHVDLITLKWGEHSLILRFAKEIYAVTHVPVGVIPSSKSGTSLDPVSTKPVYDWQPSAARLQDRGTLYGTSLFRVLSQGYSVPIRGVMWYQGEADNGRTTAQYLGDLKQFAPRIRGDLGDAGMFFGYCQLATDGENAGAGDIGVYLAVQEAQRQYAQLDPRSGVVALVDLPRLDAYHLNNTGIREAGRRLAQVVLHGLYGAAAVLEPQLQSVRFGAGRGQIVISYDKPVVVSDKAAALYRVSDSTGATLTPTAAAASGNTLVLTLKQAAQGATTLDYGYSSDPAAAWVVGADGSGAAVVFQGVPVGS